MYRCYLSFLMVVLMTLGGAVAPGGYIKGAKGRQNFVVHVPCSVRELWKVEDFHFAK